MDKLLVWYDGGCPLCRREIALMKRLDRRGAIAFTDVATAEGACPIDRADLLARFHAREPGGRIVSGAAAFAAMWREIPALRPLGLLARNRFVLAARTALSFVPESASCASTRHAATRLAPDRAAVRPTPDSAGPGQESVWRYPRPAIAEPCARRLTIMHRGVTVAETRRAVRTLETSHPPSYYFPPEDVDAALLTRSRSSSFCEWKGAAGYFDVTVEGETFRDVAWSYARPTASFEALRDHIAFYAAPFDSCLIDGERVTPQPGGFYGGWISSHVAGPFKGVPGSRLW